MPDSCKVAMDDPNPHLATARIAIQGSVGTTSRALAVSVALHCSAKCVGMRDLFEDIFRTEPLDPTEAARRAMRPSLRRRFYKEASVVDGEQGFAIALDARPIRTPARRLLAAPVQKLAHAIATEWNAQTDFIDPARMPLTRLANSIVDGVAQAAGTVADEIARYLECDLVFYRASGPSGLVVRQAEAWNPLLDWACQCFGAHFVPVEGIALAVQEAGALAAVRAGIPSGSDDRTALWRLGAVHSVTTLTGSALIALALLHGRLSADEAWIAAHVDENWNMETWGRDALALQQRAFREAEMRAAAAVLDALRE
jgi:chaperone required for assembly of F1-ATPase